MPTHDEVERFLVRVETQLPLGPRQRRRIVTELRAHFEDSIAAEITQGTSEQIATAAVIGRAGDPGEIARRYRQAHPWLSGSVGFGALACSIIGAWLLYVVSAVLPSVDPADIGIWTGVAFGLVAFAVVSVASVFMPWSRVMQVAAAVCALAAVVFGAWLAVPMILTTGDFEGYVVVIGLVTAAQGVLVLARTAVTARSIA